MVKSKGLRILCVGVGGLPSQRREDFCTAHMLQDYDAVVVNPRDLRTLFDTIWVKPLRQYLDSYGALSLSGLGYVRYSSKKRCEETLAFLEKGGILVCFMHPREVHVGRSRDGQRSFADNYDWIRSVPGWDELMSNLCEGSGTEIHVPDPNHPFAEYATHLRKSGAKWTAYVKHVDYSQWKVLGQAYGTHDVALTCQLGKGHIVVLPSDYKPDWGELLEQCIKKLLNFEEPREKPDWVKHCQPPLQQKVLGQLAKLENKIAELEEQKAKLVADNDKWERWKWLLWEKGKHHLEPVVREALVLLGFKVEAEPDKDSDGRAEDEELGIGLIEVEGTKGTIERTKLSQLVMNRENYIVNHGTTPKGILVGNPFCEEPLDNRPPQPSQKQLFAKELIEDAKTQNVTVMTSASLYDVVCSILEGRLDDDGKRTIRKAIFEGKGLVELVKLLPQSYS